MRAKKLMALNVRTGQIDVEHRMKQIEIDSYPIILTAIEISEILKVSKPTAYELMDKHGFPLIKIGRCKRVLRDEFFLWFSNH